MNRTRVSWIGSCLVVGLALAGCSDGGGRFLTGPEPTPPASVPPTQQQKLDATGVDTDTVLQVVRRVVIIPFPGGSITIGYQNGYYLVHVVMFGSDRQVKFQFQDRNGQPMKVFDPDLTRAIRVMASDENRTGLRRFDLTVYGVQASSGEYRIQGTGRVENATRAYDFYVNNLALAKLGNPYPLRGEVVLVTTHSDGETTDAHLHFNGTRTADGTLVSGSVTVYFTLDLISLKVTPQEPS